MNSEIFGPKVRREIYFLESLRNLSDFLKNKRNKSCNLSESLNNFERDFPRLQNRCWEITQTNRQNAERIWEILRDSRENLRDSEKCLEREPWVQAWRMPWRCYQYVFKSLWIRRTSRSRCALSHFCGFLMKISKENMNKIWNIFLVKKRFKKSLFCNREILCKICKKNVVKKPDFGFDFSVTWKTEESRECPTASRSVSYQTSGDQPHMKIKYYYYVSFLTYDSIIAR